MLLSRGPNLDSSGQVSVEYGRFQAASGNRARFGQIQVMSGPSCWANVGRLWASVGRVFADFATSLAAPGPDLVDFGRARPTSVESGTTLADALCGVMPRMARASTRQPWCGRHLKLSEPRCSFRCVWEASLFGAHKGGWTNVPKVQRMPGVVRNSQSSNLDETVQPEGFDAAGLNLGSKSCWRYRCSPKSEPCAAGSGPTLGDPSSDVGPVVRTPWMYPQ